MHADHDLRDDPEADDGRNPQSEAMDDRRAKTIESATRPSLCRPSLDNVDAEMLDRSYDGNTFGGNDARSREFVTRSTRSCPPPR